MSREQDNKTIVGHWFEGFWGNPWNRDIIDELATAPIFAARPASRSRGRAQFHGGVPCGVPGPFNSRARPT